MKMEDFEVYFSRKKRFLPRISDLSFYNWETQTSTTSPTPNYQIIADKYPGLLFKNKRDRKVINVDPNLANPGDNTRRFILRCGDYEQVCAVHLLSLSCSVFF